MTVNLTSATDDIARQTGLNQMVTYVDGIKASCNTLRPSTKLLSIIYQFTLQPICVQIVHNFFKQKTLLFFVRHKVYLMFKIEIGLGTIGFFFFLLL
jgi:hypothetical protein